MSAFRKGQKVRITGYDTEYTYREDMDHNGYLRSNVRTLEGGAAYCSFYVPTEILEAAKPKNVFDSNGVSRNTLLAQTSAYAQKGAYLKIKDADGGEPLGIHLSPESTSELIEALRLIQSGEDIR